MTQSINRYAIGVGLQALAVFTLSACDATDRAGTGARDHIADNTLFREVAVETGLDFRHFNGASGAFYQPEVFGPGVALLDYDNDGDLDIYLLQGSLLDPDTSTEALRFAPPVDHWPGDRLFRNELNRSGQLQFTDVTEQANLGHTGYGQGAATGDYDNDGDVDLYVTNFGSNVLYRNNGDGSFTDVTRQAGVDDPRWSTSAAFTDYDLDGDLDLFVANYVQFTVTGNKRCAGSDGQVDYCGPEAYDAVPDRLFRNEGDGTFSDVGSGAGLGTAYGPGLGVTCADFDADGRQDIYVANDGAENQLWMNRGAGGFENTALMSGTAINAYGKAEASMGVTAGDFDNDGDEDLFMTHLDRESNTLYLNDGSANFHDATDRFRLGRVSLPYTGFGSEWFDYDNDGDLDLFVANGAVKIEEDQRGEAYPYKEKNQLIRNDGPDGFTDVSTAAGPALALHEVSRGAAFGDIDNDGDVDIVVANNNGPVRLLRNEATDTNHWLTVKLQGSRTNRDGLGARVGLLRKEGETVWRRVHTDGSYVSANDPRVHFGLGDDTEVEGVLVTWPGGNSEVWRDIVIDTLQVLQQGSGKPWKTATESS